MSKMARMLRVDQAGEYGATRIYAGQLAVMGDRAPHAAEIAAMATQEAQHRARFDAMIAARGVRPTALQPLWNVAGYALGAATALIGPEAAMACTALAGGGGDPLASIMAAPIVRCDVAPWTLGGVSLAGFNFLISTAAGVAILVLIRRRPRKGDFARKTGR